MITLLLLKKGQKKNNLTVYSIAQKNIRIDGLEANSKIVIYSQTGLLVASFKTSIESSKMIQLPSNGVYIIKINNDVIKILVF